MKLTKTLKGACVGALALLPYLAAHAEPMRTDSTHLIVHTVSAHSEPGFNNTNQGLGIRWEDRKGDGFTAGTYRNSEYGQTRYAGFTFNIYDAERTRLDLMVGGADGYASRAAILMVLPTLAVKLGGGAAARFAYVPKIGDNGASALHLMLEFKL